MDVLLGPSYPLPRGPRVRLRLARPRDADGIKRLLERHEIELDVARLLRFDPRRRVVVCAIALLGSREVIRGVGAIYLDAAEPDVLIVEEQVTEGLSELLSSALISRRSAFPRVTAA